MSKKAGIVISILSIIAVVISVAALIICLKPAETDAKKTDVQYVLYLGTNDKDSNLPVFTPEQLETLLSGYRTPGRETAAEEAAEQELLRFVKPLRGIYFDEET